jgi:hypothetical protein
MGQPLRNRIDPGVMMLLLDLLLAPMTILGAAAIAGRVTDGFVIHSGVEFYPSQDPAFRAAGYAVLLSVVFGLVLLFIHAFRAARRPIPLGARVVGPAFRLVLRDHCLLALVMSALALAYVFAHGIPVDDRILSH